MQSSTLFQCLRLTDITLFVFLTYRCVTDLGDYALFCQFLLKALSLILVTCSFVAIFKAAILNQYYKLFWLLQPMHFALTSFDTLKFTKTKTFKFFFKVSSRGLQMRQQDVPPRRVCSHYQHLAMPNKWIYIASYSSSCHHHSRVKNEDAPFNP